jgi:hypothetical protein
MVAPTTLFAARPADAPSPAGDRRQENRCKLSLLGRFMRANKQEFPCKLIDISVSGAALMSPVEVDLDERVVAYLDRIGGLEGTVVRSFEGGFAMRFNASQHRREKLAVQLARLAGRKAGDSRLERRHERIEVASKTSVLKLADGIVAQVRVLDVSMSGASIATDARPPIGNEVVLGKLRARVVRHHTEGLGLEFVDLQNADASRRYFR